MADDEAVFPSAILRLCVAAGFLFFFFKFCFQPCAAPSPWVLIELLVCADSSGSGNRLPQMPDFYQREKKTQLQLGNRFYWKQEFVLHKFTSPSCPVCSRWHSDHLWKKQVLTSRSQVDGELRYSCSCDSLHSSVISLGCCPELCSIQYLCFSGY